MDYKQIQGFVKEIELFQGLTEQELDNLSKSLVEATFNRNDLLFEENGERKDLFLIYEGEVELFKKNLYGEEKRLSYFTKGDFLGEGSWASDSKHSTSAKRTGRNTFARKDDKTTKDEFKQKVGANGKTSASQIPEKQQYFL
jgi:aspartate ammonia-lyase